MLLGVETSQGNMRAVIAALVCLAAAGVGGEVIELTPAGESPVTCARRVHHRWHVTCLARAPAGSPSLTRAACPLCADLDTRLAQGAWLLEFYAPWCGYCKRLEPVYEEVAQTLAEQVRGSMGLRMRFCSGPGTSAVRRLPHAASCAPCRGYACLTMHRTGTCSAVQELGVHVARIDSSKYKCGCRHVLPCAAPVHRRCRAISNEELARWLHCASTHHDAVMLDAAIPSLLRDACCSHSARAHRAHCACLVGHVCACNLVRHVFVCACFWLSVW